MLSASTTIEPPRRKMTRKPTHPGGIIKRDGGRVPFEASRIATAMQRAGQASGEFDEDEAEFLARRVLKVIRHRFLDPEASPEVIAQKLRQTQHSLSIRSVQRVIADYGLQKKTLRP